ncbi:MAG: oxidoreductase, partial [Mycolicibacterium aromaticivorans]|nr:oxidoreductase [Mycolicibacterium aromaticivorans]
MAHTSTGLRMGAGVAAAAVALGVVQLSAAFFSPAADARTAVGTAVINATPGPVKEWAIQTFGTADKLFLSVAVIAVIGVLAAVAAIWERSRVPVGSVAFLLAAVAGSAAVLARPGAVLLDIIPTLLGAVCGIAVLRLLTSGRIVDGRASDGRATDASDDAGVDTGRRLSLATLGFAGLGLLGGVAGVV